MGRPSRREVLLGAGALGAAGALGLVSPTAAWSWSPSGSIAGTGSAQDPRRLWDAEADHVVAMLFQRREVEAVNALLQSWTHNAQPLPDGLPRDLRAFLEKARRLPRWTDQRALDAVFEFYERRGLYLGVLYGLGSGMMSCAIPREARAVYYSAGGADMKDRIAKTATLGYDLSTRDPFGPGGQLVVTCVKTRLTHAAVRYLLPRSRHWTGRAKESVPISQADIMVTWHSLATFSRNKLAAWAIPVPETDSKAYLHLWQVTAAMLGVHDEYIPVSWEEASKQSRQVLDPVLAPTKEGVELARILLNLAAEYDKGLSKPMLHAFTRYTLGDRIADWLEVPREPEADEAVETGWPPFVAFREATMSAPLAPQAYWVQDEFLRLAVLYGLGEGRRASITMPTGNNPNYH